MAIPTTPTVLAGYDNALQPGGAIRNVVVQFNNLMSFIVGSVIAALTGDVVLTPSTLSRGTTVTLAASANTIAINGVPATLAALTAQAFGSLGTIPASTWGIIALERVLAGTASFTSGAANYTDGYATEADAIAGLPAQSSDKVQVGYVTILASASGWVAGTDALAGGTGGNPATTTNYYSTVSIADSTRLTAEQVGNLDGVAISDTLV